MERPYPADWLEVRREELQAGAARQVGLVIRVALRRGVAGVDDTAGPLPAVPEGVEAARWLASAMRRTRHRNQVVRILEAEGLFDPAGVPFLPRPGRWKRAKEESASA